MLKASRTAGFTLIELLVAISILVILLLMAIPAYNRWIADAQTLNAAEALAAGLRAAYSEAIKRSTLVEFTFDPTTLSGGWTIQQPGGPTIKRDRFATGADQTVFASTPPATTTVTFNHLGLVEAANAAAPTVPFTSIDISNPNGTRPLRVMVGNLRTGIKICDPNAAFVWPKDPQACPP